MATNYPGATDAFNVPASPTTTPLSSAGTGTRNHVSHHRDLGDAVMAIQNNATKITHNHDGTGLNGPKLLQVNTHQSPDTDASTGALHHTLGTGPNQSAAGNHDHDSRYIRLDGSVTQSVTGKKTFPLGLATAVAIPDFQNSLHNHTTNVRGGPAAINGAVQPQTYYNLGPGSDNRTVTGNFTTDTFMHPNRFTIPANTALTGFVHLSYIVLYGTGQPGTGDRLHSAFFYISHNTGESPAFSNTKNLILNGGFFNGTMMQQDHLFEAGIASSKRMSMMVPIYLPSIATDRPNVVLVMRVANTTNCWMNELNWGINLNFTAQSFVAL